MVEVSNNYIRVKECNYKGEHYSVRDNGSIMRHQKDGFRVRPLDNKWTYGIKNNKNGYMIFSGNVRVHQVVATAFYGVPEDSNMIVDHIDTNRCNNRPENLKWVTRLENVLNNPITRKRIIQYCGSIEAFLNDPSKLRESALDPNTKWMRTVTKEEAQKCKKNLERWALDDMAPKVPTKRVNEGVFRTYVDNINPKGNHYENYLNHYRDRGEEEQLAIKEMDYTKESQVVLTQSLTKNALQANWKTPSFFPLCPIAISATPLEDYLANLVVGEVFSTNEYKHDSKIIDFGISTDGRTLVVLCYNDGVKGGMGGWVLSTIMVKDGKFIHKNNGSFWEENGGLKYFTLELGKEWLGGEVFDDYC